MGSFIEGRSTSSAARAGKSAARALKMDDFWGFTPGFSPGAPPREGPRGLVRPRQCTTPTVLLTYSHTLTRSTRQIRRACQGTLPRGCVNTPLFDPFAAQRERRAQVWGGQHACLTPTWRQSRRRASYKSYVERGEPSGWSCTAGNPAQAVREREPVGRRKEPPHVLHGARPRTGLLTSLNPWAGQYRVYDRYGGRVPSMVGVDGWEGRLRRWKEREGAGAVLW